MLTTAEQLAEEADLLSEEAGCLLRAREERWDTSPKNYEDGSPKLKFKQYNARCRCLI